MDFLPPQPNSTGAQLPSFPCPARAGKQARPSRGQELGGARENLYSARWCLGFQAELVILITFFLPMNTPAPHPNPTHYRTNVQALISGRGHRARQNLWDFGSISTKGHCESACSPQGLLLPYPAPISDARTARPQCVLGHPSQLHGLPGPQPLGPFVDPSPYCTAAAVPAAPSVCSAPGPVRDAGGALLGRQFIWGG
jgi:hypothetical protein